MRARPSAAAPPWRGFTATRRPGRWKVTRVANAAPESVAGKAQPPSPPRATPAQAPLAAGYTVTRRAGCHGLRLA